MVRTNPHHDWDEPARTSRDGVRQNGAEWESLRNEIVALLDHVEDQVAGVRQPRQAPAPRPQDTGRRHEALRSVRQAVDRLADRSEPEMPRRRDPVNHAARDSVADAISQIRARQTGARNTASMGQPSELSGFASALSAFGERIERFEANMASRMDRFADQPDIAAQVAQLSEVIEMLAGAVSNNGEVKRINQLADTVDRLASYQVESAGRSQQFQDRQDAGLQAIEETVRSIYERIDALETARGGDSPEIERIGREVGAISSAIAASGSDAGEILARIDALQDRIAGMPSGGGASAALGFSIDDLRDAIVTALEPRLAALDRPAAAPGNIEAQLRQIAETVEKTSAQLETLAALREAGADDAGGQANGSAIAKADLDALEQRLASLFSTEPETGQPDTGLTVVRDSIAQVDNRLGRLEAMLNTRAPEAQAPAAQPRRREPSDAMPSDPVSGAPRKVLSEDPAITLDPARPQAAPGFTFDPEAIDRPAKPQSSFAGEAERPFAAERATPAEPVPASSRANFIEAARRSARQQPEDESASKSLIARALSRFQKSEAEEMDAPDASPPIAPDPFVGPAEHDAPDTGEIEQGFFARNRRALLLGAALVVVIALAVPLALNRITGGAPSRTENPPVAAEPQTPEAQRPETQVPEPQAPADDAANAPGDVSELISGVRMVDAPSPLSPAMLSAEAVDPIHTAALHNPPDRYIDRTTTASITGTPASLVMPATSVPATIEPELLRTAAESGDARAQFEIGAIFTEGHVVEQDLAQAAAWYERSAAQGFAPAQYRLGNLYEGGRGVDRDVDQARLWYQRAAEAGNRMSMHNLASLYAGGELQTQDFEAAAHWFAEAGARGLTDSQFNLGMLYARGLGVEQSFEESYFWFSLAAQAGDEDAVGAREDVARSLETETIQAVSDRIGEWQPAEIDLAANFAPIGTWDTTFDPGQTIANRDVVERVQMLLGKLGFDVGQPDGIAGPRTREAILAFERATGMNEKGEINPRLLAVLGSQPV